MSTDNADTDKRLARIKEEEKQKFAKKAEYLKTIYKLIYDKIDNLPPELIEIIVSYLRDISNYEKFIVPMLKELKQHDDAKLEIFDSQEKYDLAIANNRKEFHFCIFSGINLRTNLDYLLELTTMDSLIISESICVGCELPRYIYDCDISKSTFFDTKADKMEGLQIVISKLDLTFSGRMQYALSLQYSPGSLIFDSVLLDEYTGTEIESKQTRITLRNSCILYSEFKPNQLNAMPFQQANPVIYDEMITLLQGYVKRGQWLFANQKLTRPVEIILPLLANIVQSADYNEPAIAILLAFFAAFDRKAYPEERTRFQAEMRIIPRLKSSEDPPTELAKRLLRFARNHGVTIIPDSQSPNGFSVLKSTPHSYEKKDEKKMDSKH